MTHPVFVAVELLRETARPPERATAGSAGLDLRYAPLDPNGRAHLGPGCRALLGTGLRVAIPSGYEGQVRPRSGWALRHGVTVLNSPGTIDCDYRGELSVLLVNHGTETVVIACGDRIAQLVIAPVVDAVCLVGRVDEATARGAGGFGSTGSG